MKVGQHAVTHDRVRQGADVFIGDVIAPAGERTRLRPEQERLVYRIAQETLRNVAKHAAPCTADVLLYRDGQGVVLDVVDDGVGFDVEAWLDAPDEGHLGVRLLGDLAATGGGLLQVASAPNRGTHWRLRIEDTNNGGTDE